MDTDSFTDSEIEISLHFERQLSGLYQLPPFLGDSTVGMIKIFQMITSKPAYISVWEDVRVLCNHSNFLLHKNIDCKKILCDIKTPTTLSLFTFQSFSQILQISVV